MDSTKVKFVIYVLEVQNGGTTQGTKCGTLPPSTWSLELELHPETIGSPYSDVQTVMTT